MTEVSHRPQAPSMFGDLNLTSGQLTLIDRLALRATQPQEYCKHIADVLRPIRRIVDTDIRYAIAGALAKYGRRR
jgi:hypothetical protein